MASIPPILDIRDDLRRAREETDADLDDELETVYDRLDAFADQDLGDVEGDLDVIDNELLRVEELLDDEEAARALRSARNRIHIYRESREQTDEDLAVVDSGVEEAEDVGPAGLPPVGEVTLTATVANTGDDTEVVPVAAFYDEDGEEVGTVEGPAFDLPAGVEQRIHFDVDVPSEASLYGVSVVEVAG
ncbi:DUF7553 family protein [Halorussus sp. AFM4]|uniref:DUF7553 family protein n=1 Tax=Halorussus sp. AFM4 TaxID=3421651 RepID=UPI003EB81EBE